MWDSSRSVGHTFIFDSVDSVHLYPRHVGAQPSPALRHRVNTLLNFYCNVYDDTAADEQRCCDAHVNRH